jgi:glycosyltransferase involved in cell wall biosynthesis
VGIEALSFGTPVVAFPVGGIPDYVLDGQTGFLARAVAPEALAEALERAVQRAVELKTMGEAGRTMVKELHSRGRHVTGIHAAYGHALALAARSAPVGVAP